MSRREIWQKIYQHFDVHEYVTSARWRADRPLSPAQKIISDLSTPFANDVRILVTGTIGTGKTTELLRVAEARADHELVVFLDLARYFERLGRLAGMQHVSSWEVCFLMGLALHRAAEESIGRSIAGDVLSHLESAWTELARASGTPVPSRLDLGQLGDALFKAGAAITCGHAGGTSGAEQSATAEQLRASWNLPIGASSRNLLDDDERVKLLLDTVGRLIAEIQGRLRPVLLVIDGLDRVESIEQARRLFVESDLLARLPCRTVICGPFALHRHAAVSVVPRYELRSLVNEPVLDPHVPARPGPGLPFFMDLFLRRAEDLGGTSLISQPLLERLAYYAGGRARDFVQSIRSVAEEAWQADVDEATDNIVDRVLDQERRILETGLHRGHIEVLEAVMSDPAYRLQRDDEAWELLTWSRLLAYLDRSEWFYPHPLLTRHLLGPGSLAARVEGSRSGVGQQRRHI